MDGIVVIDLYYLSAFPMSIMLLEYFYIVLLALLRECASERAGELFHVFSA